MTPTNQPKPITRRNFLKIAGAAVGGAAVLCAGGGVLATLPPKINLTETQCGENANLNGKILIAYASKSGTTAEVAEAMGKAMCAQGTAVDVMPAKNVKSLDGYRAVVVGSGIRTGAWLKEAIDFVQKNAAQLNALPAAIFTVHLLNLDDSEASQAGRQTYIAPVMDIITPKAQEFFAGRMDFSKLSFLEKTMSKAMKAEEEDRRDWQKINAWATGLATTL